MSTSSIEIYKQSLKEFGITEEVDVPAVAKITFVQDQIGEQRKILNRLVIDYTIAKTHEDIATDVQMKDVHRKKADDYKSDIRQILGALKVNLGLIAGLRKEYNLEADA